MKEEHAQLIEEFTKWLAVKEYKVRGIDEKERAARQYLDYMELVSGDIFRAGLYDAEGFREHMRISRRLDACTINVRIAYLRLFYRYLLSAGKAIKNPFMDIERMRESERIPKNIVSIEQMGKLLDSIEVKKKDDFEFKTLVELLYSSGARISEIENLKREDIDLEEGTFIIRDDKSRKDRKLPLTSAAREHLTLYLESVPTRGVYVFLRHRPRVVGERVNRRLRELAARLGLPPLSCHGIRHTTATHLLKKGADIRQVQEILGHRNIKTTEAYLRIFPDDLREIIEKNHPREGTDDESDGNGGGKDVR